MPDFYHYEEYLFSKNDIKQIFNLLPEDSKISSKGKLLAEYIHLPDIPEKGEKFVNITQRTPEEKDASISQNLGKFTLIEFWSSNCGPCRIKHPMMKMLYEKYHDAGLNIIGISADTDREAWTAAIKSDSLLWLNISDLKGFNSSAFMIYGVKSIPKLILLDENGIILDNELASKQIDIYLNNLFKENGL
jgi:thiol-disulfide isomerase/thioredoxin